MYTADLSAAFDMVRQDILVDICCSKGFPESVTRVLYNFLNDRLGFVIFAYLTFILGTFA
jgi:hypothetical protein